MKTYKLTELVEIARKNSPFYKNLYKNVKKFSGELAELPILEETSYWKANSFQNNKLMTGPRQGILLRTGGTSGNPKMSMFSSEEWEGLCQITADKLCEAGFLQSGDIVANMFVSGKLYGGFLLISGMLKRARCSLLELPIGPGNFLDLSNEVSMIKELQANVLLGPPYMLMAIAAYIKENRIGGLKLDRFLYGSDLLLDSQRLFIQKLFPQARVSSSGFASSDSGFLGYADETCSINEYRTDSRLTILEIVDESTGKVIDEPNQPGLLLATNLTKSLMPVIRYPVGDLAMWMEQPRTKHRKLKLLGRRRKSETQIELGGKKFDFRDFYQILTGSKFSQSILGFQVCLRKNGNVVLKIALESDWKVMKGEFEQIVQKALPKAVSEKIEVETVRIFDLQFDACTYKSVKIIQEKA